MEKTIFEKDIERLLTWKEIYDKFDFAFLSVQDRYTISWFIVKLGNDMRKLGYNIEYHKGFAYEIIEEEIKKSKEKKELEEYRKAYPDFKFFENNTKVKEDETEENGK